MKSDFLYKINEDFYQTLIKRIPILSSIRIILIIFVYTAIGYTSYVLGNSGLLLTPILSFILAGFVNAGHDCVHLGQFKSSKMNRIFGIFWSTPLLINFSRYKYQHLIHHQKTSFDGDTEPSFEFRSFKQYLFEFIGIHYWYAVLRGIYRINRNLFPESVQLNRNKIFDVKIDNAIIEVFILITFCITYKFPIIMLHFYWIPLLFYPGILFVFSLPEHYKCEKFSKDIRTNTRSVSSNFLVRFFMWNANYHSEHHAFPRIPANNLGKLENVIPKNYFNTDTSYIYFHYKVILELVNKKKNKCEI
ncbi:fatty acid desaturase family protein [Fluviispira sanaruensis]|uniref:Omega-3 fatty acid desaturase n=1 Tax=Fluviispira sanaruensis TaxID=2493639 RepID=A0A4P2VY07_FLUSA|nr:fatty acid desaturase [Fluviispira sanaruensis]BBH54555.1 omega-3 fatty acid desaturase [Fluviispira sanaruensis]